jgi:hypothetical protein
MSSLAQEEFYNEITRYSGYSLLSPPEIIENFEDLVNKLKEENELKIQLETLFRILKIIYWYLNIKENLRIYFLTESRPVKFINKPNTPIPSLKFIDILGQFVDINKLNGEMISDMCKGIIDQYEFEVWLEKYNEKHSIV